MAKKYKNNVADIAKIVGVSPGTVSNALNNKKGVSEDTRQIIIETAKKLGYERSYSRNEGKTLRFIQVKRHGEVIGDTYFFAQVMAGIEEECRKNGFQLLMTNINLTEVSNEEAISFCEKEISEGVIVLATELRNEDLTILNKVEKPIVMLDNCFRGNKYDSVLINNEDGVFLAVKHLVEKGHRRIGLLSSSKYINNFYYRKKSFCSAVREFGLEVNPNDEFSVCSSVEGSYRDMLNHLEMKSDLPTAFFAENDIIAFGAIRALTEKGIKVPEDVSIIGFDDILFCEMSSPRLTTICVDKKGMGALAVRKILGSLDKDKIDCATKTQVKCKLIVRDSVKEIRNSKEIDAEETISFL